MLMSNLAKANTIRKLKVANCHSREAVKMGSGATVKYSYVVGWLNQAILKNMLVSQPWITSPSRSENNQIFETTTQYRGFSDLE